MDGIIHISEILEKLSFGGHKLMDAAKQTEILQKCDELKLLALCIYGEARGESELGKTAVGCVIRNRVNESKNKSYREIILKPMQFSCFNFNDSNLVILVKFAENNYILDESFNECMKVAKLIYENKVGDITNKANHYFNPAKCNPYWIEKMSKTMTLGRHVFYRDEKK